MPQEKLRVDYHVHPNFPRDERRHAAHAAAWWDAFARHQLDVALITEHAYRNPSASYHQLLRHRPKNAATTIYPGVEALTREGVDLIIYAEDPEEIYTPSPLLLPYALSYEEAVDQILQRNLQAYVTHPTTLGTTSILRHRGKAFTREMVEALRAVERHNAGYSDFIALFERLPNIVFGWVAEELVERCHMPLDLYEHIPAVRWVGGSDAHVPRELGSYVEMDWPDEHVSLYEHINSPHAGAFIFRPARGSAFTLVRQATNVLKEYILKRMYHLVR